MKNRNFKYSILIPIFLSSLPLFADFKSTVADFSSKAKTILEDKNPISLDKEQDNNITLRFQRLHKEHINDIWEDVINRLEESLEIEAKIEKAPNFSFFGSDKKSLREDFNEVLDEIIKILPDNNILDYRKKIDEYRENINSLEQDILEYREKRVSAPIESSIRTTKADYDKKIAEAKGLIASNKKAIEKMKQKMSQSFMASGINLTPEQVDTLLSRVDGDDIIKVTLIINTLKDITSQLLGIMQESNEELAHAKKYYGMHMVLLELVVYVQQKFKQKIAKEYLPKINSIIKQTKAIIDKTKAQITKEHNQNRKAIYMQNLKSQELTLKTALMYRENLLNELRQLDKAQQITKENLELSKNTYETVRLSNDLFKVISSNQETMEQIMKLQIPTIIPFKNIQIRDKYKELTNKIREGHSRFIIKF